MKTPLLAIMFAVTTFGALSVSTTMGQTSQTIQVDVPFAFTAHKKIHPAGRYRIESASDRRVLWRIRGSRKRRSEFLLATSLAGSSAGDLRVTFHRYGNRQFLAGFKTQSYEVSLPVSRLEKSLRLARVPFVPVEVTNLETVTEGSR